MKRLLAGALLSAAMAGCTVIPPSAEPPRTSGRPLEQLPAEASLSQAETDLLATASAQFGPASLERALAAPRYMIVKRFVGMAPPPPPGAGADWRPPTPSALLIHDNGRWMVATGSEWRVASAAAGAELDRLIASPRFWSEPAFTQACPDYGASLLLLKVPGRERTVRNSQCTSTASDIVSQALQA